MSENVCPHGPNPISLQMLDRTLQELIIHPDVDVIGIQIVSLEAARLHLDGLVLGMACYDTEIREHWVQFNNWIIRKFDKNQKRVYWHYALQKQYPDDVEAINQLYPLYQEFLKTQKRKRKV